MEKRKKMRALVLACVMSLTCLLGIPTSVFAEPEGTSIQIGAQTEVVAPGQSVQLSVSGIEGNVTWGVSGNTSASTIITQDGYLTIGSDEKADAITVIITSNVDPSVNATKRIKIAHPISPEDPDPDPEPTETPEITSVFLSGGGSVMAGGQIRLSAKVNGTGEYDKSVSWGVTGNRSSATTITDGLLTVGEDESNSAVTVIVVANGDHTVSSSTKVTILPIPDPDPEIIDVMINGSSSIKPGQSEQYNATVNGRYKYDKTVTWSIKGAHGKTRISSAGILTIDPDETSKTITVIATSNGNKLVKAEKSVTVKLVEKETIEETKPTETKKQYVSAKTDYISGTHEVISGTHKITEAITPVKENIPGSSSSASAINRPTGGSTAATITKATEQAITKKVTEEIDAVIAETTDVIKSNAEKKKEDALSDTDNTSVISKEEQVETSDNSYIVIAGIVFAIAVLLAAGMIVLKVRNKKKNG